MQLPRGDERVIDPRGQSHLLPRNIEAEEAVLGAMLLSREVVPEVIEILSDHPAFHSDAHNKIYAAIWTLFDRDEPVDVVTVANELERADQLKSAGGATYLSGLTLSVPSFVSASDYAKIVRDKYLLRQLIHKCTEVRLQAFEDSDGVENIIESAEQDIYRLADMRIRKSAQSLGAGLFNVVKDLENIRGNRNEISGLPTGFRDLDIMTTGLHPGDLLILAARPSVGKTAFAINIASNVALRQNKTVMFFSLEMTHASLCQRILCSESQFSLKKLRGGAFGKHDFDQLTQKASEIIERNPYLYIDDTPGLTPLEMRAKARRLASGKSKLDLVIVDYLQMMEPGVRNRGESREREVAQMSRSLKRMALELRVPVIALSQLSRQVENRSDKKPQLSDLRESGSLEQDADIVAFLHREDRANDAGMRDITFPVTLMIAKQRNGPVGNVNLIFQSDITRFQAYAPEGALGSHSPTA